jgi:hypothetical protein
MQKLLKIGQKVYIGQIDRHGTIDGAYLSSTHEYFLYVVLLDKGVWLADDSGFVTLFVAHSDNIKPVEDGTLVADRG